jgi:hypothetical protein
MRRSFSRRAEILRFDQNTNICASTIVDRLFRNPAEYPRRTLKTQVLEQSEQMAIELSVFIVE